MEQAVAVTGDILRAVARQREVRAYPTVTILCQPSDPFRAGDINGEGETLIRFKVIACCKTIRRAILLDDIAAVGTDRVVE